MLSTKNPHYFCKFRYFFLKRCEKHRLFSKIPYFCAVNRRCNEKNKVDTFVMLSSRCTKVITLTFDIWQ